MGDGVCGEASQDPVSAGHLARLAGHGHQRVHLAGVLHAPDPGMHAAHAVADDGAHPLDAQHLFHQPVLRVNHVLVVVLGEVCTQAVGRFAALAMADAVGNDDEVIAGVQRLPGAEHLASEGWRQHALRRAGRAVQHQHRLAGRGADRHVVHPQLVHHFAGLEAKVLQDGALFLRGRIVRWRGRCGLRSRGEAHHDRAGKSQTLQGRGSVFVKVQCSLAETGGSEFISSARILRLQRSCAVLRVIREAQALVRASSLRQQASQKRQRG